MPDYAKIADRKRIWEAAYAAAYAVAANQDGVSKDHAAWALVVADAAVNRLDGYLAANKE